jgi:hypothetical protein
LLLPLRTLLSLATKSATSRSRVLATDIGPRLANWGLACEYIFKTPADFDPAAVKLGHDNGLM